MFEKGFLMPAEAYLNASALNSLQFSSCHSIESGNKVSELIQVNVKSVEIYLLPAPRTVCVLGSLCLHTFNRGKYSIQE